MGTGEPCCKICGKLGCFVDDVCGECSVEMDRIGKLNNNLSIQQQKEIKIITASIIKDSFENKLRDNDLYDPETYQIHPVTEQCQNILDEVIAEFLKRS